MSEQSMLSNDGRTGKSLSWRFFLTFEDAFNKDLMINTNIFKAFFYLVI